MPEYDVFLSHNSKDKDRYIRPLAERLSKDGLKPWFDEWEMIGGDSPIEKLPSSLSDCGACAVFISESNLGKWQNQEFQLAQVYSIAHPEFRLFAVLLDYAADPSDPNTFPPFLTVKSWVDLRKGIEDERGIYLLKCAIKGTRPGPPSDSTAANGALLPEEDFCPYRGLQVFTENDAKFFFGRDNDIQRLVEKLKSTRFLGVLGASGSGKSSLVRAGLVPALRDGKELSGSNTWSIVPTFHPDTSPLGSLVSYFAELSNVNTNGLLTQLREDDKSLHIAVRKYLESTSYAKTRPQRVLIVVDQFEEVFTLCKDEHDRRQFLANLLYAGTVPDGGCLVVLTMRADFYHKCATYSEFSKALAASQYLVSPMEYEGLLEAIEAPAKLVGIEFEPGLVKTIADDVMNQPGALPLLEHALLELWNRRKNGKLTLEDYIDIGRVQGAIAKRADAIYDSFTAEDQIITRRIMLRLTQLGEGTEDTRRRATLDELITNSEEREPVERVIDTLAKPENRLLTIDRQSETPVVEVSHEALIRGWERLREWLEEDREGLRLHLRLSENAREWDSRLKSGISDEGLLYRGLTLEQTLEWRKHHESDLNELERRFLDQSELYKQNAQKEREEHERQRLEAARQKTTIERKARIRQRRLTVVLAVLFLGTSGLGLWTYEQYKESRSRELAKQAMEELSKNPILSVLLAKEAAGISHTLEAENALRNSLLASAGIVTSFIDLSPAEVSSEQFSPDGRYMVRGDDRIGRICEIATGRTVQELRGHALAVLSAGFSSDGRFVVTASRDKTARIWEVSTGQSLTELRGHSESVYSAAFSPDGKYVVTLSQDKTARIWDVASGKTFRELSIEDPIVNGASFSPNGTYAIITNYNTMLIWNVADGKVAQKLKTHFPIANRALFSPDDKLVVTQADFETSRISEVATGRTLLELKGHDGPITDAVFSPDGKYVATASWDETVRVWDVASGLTVRELKGHTSRVNSASFSRDGTYVVTASDDKTAIVWQIATGEIVQHLKGHSSSVESAVFSPDGKHIVTTGRDDNVLVWEFETAWTTHELRAKTWLFKGAVFSPNGKYMVLPGADNSAWICDVATGQRLRGLKGNTGSINDVRFSFDGKYVVTASSDNTARIWEAESGRELRKLKGHSGQVNNAAFSTDGKYVVTASSDNTARVWDVSTGQTLQELKGHTAYILKASFSFDGKYILTLGADKTVRVWETTTGLSLHELKGHTAEINCAIFSPEGRSIVTASNDTTARIWDIASGQTTHELKGHTYPIADAAYSPDGKYLVTASYDRTARIWDVATGQTIQELKGHTEFINSAAFSPNGKNVVTSSWDATARIWDVATGRTVRELTGHTKFLYNASFSPDGKYVITSSADETVRIYNCEGVGDLRSLLELANRRVPREMTDLERYKYLNQ